tara:strand:- start:386 stop:889 length:504 start_codon:yes stop_codon:yes gene_type:complete
MTVSITTANTPTELPPRTRPTFTINETINASCTVAAGQACAVTNVTATVDGTEPDLVITPSTTSVTITGSFADPFSDSFTYVDEGQTDLTQTPITVEGADNLPADKIFFDLDQDMTAYTLKTFTVVVSWESGPIGNLTAQPDANFTVTMKINNEWEGIRSLVDDYYD